MTLPMPPHHLVSVCLAVCRCDALQLLSIFSSFSRSFFPKERASDTASRHAEVAVFVARKDVPVIV